MTRKDYVAIASVIKEVRESHDIKYPGREIAERLASVMAADNPNFDRARFLDACGVRA